MNIKHRKVSGRSDTVPLGSSKVVCECIYYCVRTSDCQITLNVDALAPNIRIVHDTQ